MAQPHKVQGGGGNPPLLPPQSRLGLGGPRAGAGSSFLPPPASLPPAGLTGAGKMQAWEQMQRLCCFSCVTAQGQGQLGSWLEQWNISHVLVGCPVKGG